MQNLPAFPALGTHDHRLGHVTVCRLRFPRKPLKVQIRNLHFQTHFGIFSRERSAPGKLQKFSHSDSYFIN